MTALVATPSCNARAAADAFFRVWIRRFGLSRQAVSDGGSHFTSELFTDFLLQFNVCHLPLPLHSPSHWCIERIKLFVRLCWKFTMDIRGGKKHCRQWNSASTQQRTVRLVTLLLLLPVVVRRPAHSLVAWNCSCSRRSEAGEYGASASALRKC